jgi:Family of unknown function (DUF5706)
LDSQKERMESAKWLFERTLGWIATADVKVGVTVAIDTAMLGGLAAVYTASDVASRTHWANAFAIAATASMVIAMFCAAMAAIPRMLGPVSSMIFFGRIAERTQADYVDEYQKLSSTAFLEDLTVQIHRNAQIATAKHQWVRKGLTWSFYASIPWIASIVLLIKK